MFLVLAHVGVCISWRRVRTASDAKVFWVFFSKKNRLPSLALTSMNAPLLDIAGLNVRFGDVAAVRDVSLSVQAGEAVGIVGESGSGKSAAMLATMRLHPAYATISAQRHLLGGKDVRLAKERDMRDLRGRFAAMIFQDPLSALNPLLPIGTQIAEVLSRHRGFSRRSAQAEAIALLAQVGIGNAAERAQKYPHEFSGGMRQRVMIASALAGDPSLLIADEPTTALDVTVQAELARLIAGLQRERHMGLIWVTHDLALMAGIVDRVVVMYAGRIVEMAPVSTLYATPRHPYTVALLESLPRLDGRRGRVLGGGPPRLDRPISGCAFAPRCPQRHARCTEAPPLVSLGDSQIACWAAA
jgi:oligopeptide/dipeptide ABC transporter ATP-binding protein